jgi:beta-glucuronidase
MKLPYLLCVAILAAQADAQGKQSSIVQPIVLADVDHRQTISLNGDWHYILDPYSNGMPRSANGEIGQHSFFEDRELPSGSNDLIEYSFAKSPTLKVPGDWNTQREDLLNYEGLLWYQRDFDLSPKPNTRVFFHVGAANYKAYLFVNGKHICDHEGGFTPFDCEVTAVLHPGKNFAVVAVDDTRQADGIPTLKTDWYNYGGLTRDVSIVTVPDTFIDDYDLHLSRADHKTIEGYVHVVDAPAGTKVHVAIPEVYAETDATTDSSGRAAISFVPAHLELWEPGHPKLYKVEVTARLDQLTDQIGFRTIEVSGSKILLNGKPIVLHGVNIHAEAPYRSGRVNTDADVKTLFDWTQELGCNFVRLAHYPHDERMTREADRRGILVWSEIPVYWGIHFDDPAVLAKAEQQLGEEIRRDRNKASVILWSIANETPNTPARTEFLNRLAAYARETDPTRLITAALLVRGEGNTKIVDDPLGKSLDVLGTNEYLGWYEKSNEDFTDTKWDIRYDKPVIMSEFGGEAQAGLHGPETQRWSEEFQAAIYRKQIAMLNKIPQLRGTTPWILMDFRSPVRLLPGMQDGFNRKGLISDKGKKKLAFSVLQKAYKDNDLGKPE